LERIDTSDFSSDGVVRLYASVVDLEGTVDENRPAPAFALKLNGKNVGPPEKAVRFQMAGEPIDIVLVVESSALYGPPKVTVPPPPPPTPKPAPGAPKPPRGASKTKAAAPPQKGKGKGKYGVARAPSPP